MDSYIIKQSKSILYEMIFYFPLFALLICFVVLYHEFFHESVSGRGGNVYIAIILLPLYLIYLIYKYIRYVRNGTDRNTLIINPKKIEIYGYGKNIDLEWRKIKRIDIVNGSITKLVFHLKHDKLEINLYGYQSTFKMKMALQYFGNGIEIYERRKVFVYFYIPFW